jgi:hypothetical protein
MLAQATVWLEVCSSNIRNKVSTGLVGAGGYAGHLHFKYP